MTNSEDLKNPSNSRLDNDPLYSISFENQKLEEESSAVSKIGSWQLRDVHTSNSGQLVLTFNTGASIELDPLAFSGKESVINFGHDDIKIFSTTDQIFIQVNGGIKIALPTKNAA